MAMSLGLIYLVVFGALLIASIVLAIVVMRSFRNGKNIEIIGGQLENSDTSINDAMQYLEITNEWST